MDEIPQLWGRRKPVGQPVEPPLFFSTVEPHTRLGDGTGVVHGGDRSEEEGPDRGALGERRPLHHGRLREADEETTVARAVSTGMSPPCVADFSVLLHRVGALLQLAGRP